MAVSSDIVATWRRPRQVMRKLLSMGRREDRALAILIAACLLIFVAQWPRLSREAFMAPEGAAPLDARLAITFFAMMMVWPILAYALAAVTHILARIAGGRGTWYSARLALFWSLLATSPAWLLHGLVAGFIGPGPAEQVVGALLLLGFLAIWGISLREAEREPEAQVPA
ncbi:YIP1 family protein [Roseicyclus persicicus]|uniref:YIP1 family protein n=1 Tax=Roseicyclus persicicus TaxID=2650661 RepID=A0A7X6H179_9RHOB|nr:YIP1 family protein [Roseibacterium persicicum]NKX46085.1 YIP1 family protein [Roseibacterium persicicum]